MNGGGTVSDTVAYILVLVAVSAVVFAVAYVRGFNRRL